MSRCGTAAGDINLFHDPEGELGLSALAYHFLGGILAHAESLTALFTPTVNSFKRINAAPTVSGATWSPNAISYGANNRTHMVRIPEPGRFELRLMDGAANPYLLQAGLLAGGLDGIADGSIPAGGSTSTCTRRRGASRRSPVAAQPPRCVARVCGLDDLARGLGAEFVDSYVKLQMAQWNDYMRHLTEWEREHTLDV